MMMVLDKGWLRKNRQKVIYGSIGIIAAVLMLTIFSEGMFTDKNMDFNELSWEEKDDATKLCSSCSADEQECQSKMKYIITITGVDARYLSDQSKELQCKVILDGVDLWKTEGKYYCDIRDTIESWLLADIRQDHEVSVCCGTYGLEFDALDESKNQAPHVCKGGKLEALCPSG